MHSDLIFDGGHDPVFDSEVDIIQILNC